MSLAEIKAKIETEAKSESQRILDAAREEIVLIQRKTSNEIAQIESQYADRLKREEPEISCYDTNVMDELQRFYEQTVDKLCSRNFDSASALVHEANRIFTYASGYVQNNVVQELKRLFFYDNVMLYDVPAREEFRNLIRTMTKDDLFIIVSFSGESPAVKELAQALKMRDIPFISITRLHDNTLASLSTVNFYVSPARFQLYDKEDDHVAFQSMMPYFVLAEIWYVKYCMYLHHLKQEQEASR